MSIKKILVSLIAGAVMTTAFALSAMAEEYEIASADDLKAYAELVNGGADTSDDVVTVTADIDLDDVEWTPIGKVVRDGSGYKAGSYPFAGEFDGGDFEIKGLFISEGAEDDGIGLFGGITTGAVIKNVNLVDVEIETPDCRTTGGLVGIIAGGTVEDCTVSGSVSAKCAGGLVGRILADGTVENCTNKATVTATGSSDTGGGIVGKAYYTKTGKEMNIIGCTNDGKIIGDGAYGVAGIAGFLTGNVYNCTNNGNVVAEGNASAGGIVSEHGMYGEVDGNVNNGDITAESATAAVGGIVGWLRYTSSVAAGSSYEVGGKVSITNNTNNGSISCVNTGSTAQGAGGIVGTVYNQATVSGNKNTAESIVGTTHAAGIVGYSIQAGGYNAADIQVIGNASTTPIENIEAETTALYAYDGHGGVTVENNGTAFVAECEGTKYVSLQAAVDAAEENDTIVVIGDITAEVLPTADTTNNDANALIHTDKDDVITIDLNGKTISVKGSDEAKYDTLAIRNNGNLTITDTSAEKTGKITLAFDGTQESGSSQIHSTILNFGTLTIDGGTIENTATAGYGAYAINNYSWGGNAVLTINDGVIIGERSCAVYAYAYDDYSKNLCNVTIYGGTFEGATYALYYGNSGMHAENGANVTIEGGTFTGGTAALLIKGATTVSSVIAGEFSSDVSEYLDATKNACVPSNDGMYTVVDEALAVEAIEVKFENVTATDAEGEKLYNINLVATDNDIINRLNSADLTFKLTSVHDMAYTIIASNDEIKINPVNNSADRYEFHFNGKTDVETDTANTITIGQVKFEGYGEYDFEIVLDAPNAVHATTLYDNIVDTFVPNGEDGVQAGELIITDKIDGDYIAVPTRNLIINVDFPNSVEEQAIAYNDMKVVISGGDLAKAITIDLGGDAVETDVETENDKADAKYVADFVDGAYVVTLTDVLTVNNSYNVEVSGAGYRTARYTVTMNCEEKKTLNFWNNVKDNAIEVEEGKDSSKKNVTFLAGDIVKDSTINIYDLSAVVSYFGETGLSVDNHPEYAKYDLNRDGKIDSKDVAYVLVSWGK